DELAAWRHRILPKTNAAVHLHRHFKPVPVYRRHFRKAIFEHNSYLVALINFNGGTWYGPVESPRVHLSSGHELGFDNFRNQVEFLPAVDHLEGQLWKIRLFDRQVES